MHDLTVFQMILILSWVVAGLIDIRCKKADAIIVPLILTVLYGVGQFLITMRPN